MGINIYAVEEMKNLIVISREYFSSLEVAKNWAKNFDNYIISELVDNNGRIVFNKVIEKV